MSAVPGYNSMMLTFTCLFQYFFDTTEAEQWMSEQELYMMTEERGKDELSCSALMKKHNVQEQDIEQYASTIRDLGERARNMIDEQHPLR